ncbi:pre-mRNA-splicing factor syf1 [Dispira simplex]|nr:pre-mRNA-splicing factor syf1 [Dispira simplex]
MASTETDTLDAVLNFTNVHIPDDDLPFEQDIADRPTDLKCWLRYIDRKSEAPPVHVVFLYERAVQSLPGSYKLWKRYLDLRTALLKGRNPVVYAEHYKRVNMCFERALILLHKMPRMWLDYGEFLLKQPCVTQTRRTLDRALRALPITQHDRVWPLYLLLARRTGGETAVKVYRRFLKLDPNGAEEYVDLLLELERYDEAATILVKMIEDERFVSRRGQTRFQLWMQLCNVLSQHPQTIHTVRADAILKSGISRYPDQAGRLWNALAQYWILLRQFEKARDVYEEALRQVMTVRDFTQVFDAYAEFQETLVNAQLQQASQREVNNHKDSQADLTLDLSLLRFEDLMDRRPFLVNDVLLRQNPHNVMEWEKRVALWEGHSDKILATYADAVRTVHPKKATGQLHHLWIHYANFYDTNGQLDMARQTFDKAAMVDFRNVNDLVEVWCAYAEMELRHHHYDQALAILGRATRSPPRAHQISFHNDSLPVRARVFKSLKLWSFYVDLQESIGTLDSTRAAYDRILELKIATPQTIVNYAQFLQEHKYFEDSFKVYERGIDLFGYPVAFELWNIYLVRFLDRYGDSKLERARDLFEQALAKCPPEYAKALYLLYGKLEEDHGSARQAVRIYERGSQAVSDKDRMEMLQFYIARTGELFGVVATREIYERALQTLPDGFAKVIGLQYAQMELQLGEIDRARVLFGYTAQFCNPHSNPQFWQAWHEFEVKHGNESTFKDMLRVKRSMQTKFNTDVNFIAAQVATARAAQQLLAEDTNTGEKQPKSDSASDPKGAGARSGIGGTPGVVHQSRDPSKFVKASTGPVSESSIPTASTPDS